MGELLSLLLKISSESKQSGRHDCELFKSFKLLKEKQHNNILLETLALINFLYLHGLKIA